MKKSGKIIALLILIVIVLVYFTIKSSACSDLDCIYFPGKENWKLVEIYVNSKKAWKGLFGVQDGYVRVEKNVVDSPQYAEEFTNTRLMQVQSIFDKARSPYPGAISDEIECQEKFKPVEKEITTGTGITLTYYREYLNNRLVIGTCIDEDVEYIGYVAIFYCHESSEWYQMEIIKPSEKRGLEEDYISLFKEIRCQRPFSKMGKLLP